MVDEQSLSEPADRIADRPGRARPRRRSRADRPGQRHGRRAVGQRRRHRRRRGRRADRRRRSDPLQRLVAGGRTGRQRSRRPTSSWSPTATGGAPTTGAAPRTSPATPSRSSGPQTRVGGLRRRPARRVPRRRTDRLLGVACRTGRSRRRRPATANGSATCPRPARRWRSTVTRTRRGPCSIRPVSSSRSPRQRRSTTSRVLQPSGLRDVRRLETVSVTVDGGEPQQVVLDDRSLITGQRIPIPGDHRSGDDSRLPRAGSSRPRVTADTTIPTARRSGSPRSTPASARARSGSSSPATSRR